MAANGTSVGVGVRGISVGFTASIGAEVSTGVVDTGVNSGAAPLQAVTLNIAPLKIPSMDKILCFFTGVDYTMNRFVFYKTNKLQLQL